jgi:3-hydroxybutyryl-CoA dehydratase
MSVSPGQLLKPLRIASVSAADMQEWAQVLRDPNPIHLDAKVVAARGLGDRVINQGPANLAYIIAMLQAALPQARVQSFDVRYLDNVFAGDAVEAGAKIVSVATADTSVSCEVWLKVEGRGAALQGSAVLELQGRVI